MSVPLYTEHLTLNFGLMVYVGFMNISRYPAVAMPLVEWDVWIVDDGVPHTCNDYMLMLSTTSLNRCSLGGEPKMSRLCFISTSQASCQTLASSGRQVDLLSTQLAAKLRNFTGGFYRLALPSGGVLPTQKFTDGVDVGKNTIMQAVMSQLYRSNHTVRLYGPQ